MSASSLTRNRALVDERAVEDALDFLRSSAEDIGRARKRQILSEKRRAHVEALEMKKYPHLSVAAQTREARASDEYIACIEEEALAVCEFEKLKSLREAASALIEVYRTESANYRGMRV